MNVFLVEEDVGCGLVGEFKGIFARRWKNPRGASFAVRFERDETGHSAYE
jgi:hypothetical protein